MQLKIGKLIFGGQGLGYAEERGPFLVWNALPDEEVEVENWKKKSGILEGIAQNIVKPSPHRIDAKESHFLSCSPWQVMDWDYENEQKVEIARETFQKIAKPASPAGGLKIENCKIVANGPLYGYRNKMEFSFAEVNGKISLALFARGSHAMVALEKCELASSAINETARAILGWINEVKIPLRSLKTLIVRSNQRGETIAGLFIKDKIPMSDIWASFDVGHLKPKLVGIDTLDSYSHILKNVRILGASIYYSTHQSPASVPTELLHHEGQNFLEEEILGRKLRYGLFSFFQVNVPVFAKVLTDIADFVADDADKLDILDLYCGTGAIGIYLASLTSKFRCPTSKDAQMSDIKTTPCISFVDNNEESVRFAQENIELNGLKNCEAVCASTEKALDLIVPNQLLILDPPRSGLHKKVIEKILEVKPKKIIYLSCNISTQARDLAFLTKNYKLETINLYNFFPRTPHIEGLAILERK